MQYDARLRNTTETYGFTKDSPCLWLVYPPGSGGDLWGAILGQHYPRTGNNFLGIDQTGRVILDTIDNKGLNWQLIQNNDVDIGPAYVDLINYSYTSLHFPYSMSGHCILVNHLWQDCWVEKIINMFSAAKVIRILPSTEHNIKLTEWLSAWKNHNTVMDFESMTCNPQLLEQIQNTNFEHSRVLNLPFEQLWSLTNFETSYSKIVEFLNLPYKLVRHDLLRYWLDCQHTSIKPELIKLFCC